MFHKSVLSGAQLEVLLRTQACMFSGNAFKHFAGAACQARGSVTPYTQPQAIFEDSHYGSCFPPLWQTLPLQSRLMWLTNGPQQKIGQRVYDSRVELTCDSLYCNTFIRQILTGVIFCYKQVVRIWWGNRNIQLYGSPRTPYIHF